MQSVAESSPTVIVWNNLIVLKISFVTTGVLLLKVTWIKILRGAIDVLMLCNTTDCALHLRILQLNLVVLYCANGTRHSTVRNNHYLLIYPVLSYHLRLSFSFQPSFPSIPHSSLNVLKMLLFHWYSFGVKWIFRRGCANLYIYVLTVAMITVCKFFLAGLVSKYYCEMVVYEL